MSFTKQFLVFFTISFHSLFASEYREKIQPIFDNRCIACHSCLNGPCQLNLQNYENFARGANHKNVYDGLRIESVTPTRPGIDGVKVTDWRKLGFFDVNQSKKLEENIFYQILGKKKLEQKDIPFLKVEESVSCIDNTKKLKLALSQSTDLQMPYALPPLQASERQTLGTWLANGALGPEALNAPDITKIQIKNWESFFNQKAEKEKLVSRYLFEHLFLAHIYFPEAPTSFFRLVRSHTKCEQGINEINTRRPNDNPKSKDFYYCLKF